MFIINMSHGVEHIVADMTKGTLLTVDGYFKPDEWIDQQGTKHNRIVFIANKFYPALEKEEPGAESTEQPTTKTKKK